MQLIDQKINELKIINEEITIKDKQASELRKEVFELMAKDELQQYKNEDATISTIIRKIVKYDKKEMLKKLQETNSVNYYESVIKSNLDDEIKKGLFNPKKQFDIDYQIEEKESLAIRFNKK